jgi:hypothetical protein
MVAFILQKKNFLTKFTLLAIKALSTDSDACVMVIPPTQNIQAACWVVIREREIFLRKKQYETCLFRHRHDNVGSRHKFGLC